jgi:hypothetical protein
MYTAPLYTYSPVRIGTAKFVKIWVALLKNHRPYRTSVFQLAWRVKMCCAQLNRFRFTAKRERKQLEEFPHRRWYSHTYNHRLVFYYILNYTLKKWERERDYWMAQTGGSDPGPIYKRGQHRRVDTTVSGVQRSQLLHFVAFPFESRAVLHLWYVKKKIKINNNHHLIFFKLEF